MRQNYRTEGHEHRYFFSQSKAEFEPVNTELPDRMVQLYERVEYGFMMCTIAGCDEMVIKYRVKDKSNGDE